MRRTGTMASRRVCLGNCEGDLYVVISWEPRTEIERIQKAKHVCPWCAEEILRTRANIVYNRRQRELGTLYPRPTLLRRILSWLGF
jgi:hypothetical protein